MQYKKKAYFGASFDMTISKESKVVEEKIQKNWDRYVLQGKFPQVKYFEDPENPNDRGPRVMPKFIIGGSLEDLEQLTDAYLQNNKASLNAHPLKYAVIAQIDAQLQKILSFYNDPKNLFNVKFSYAREQYLNFQTFFNDIKKSIQYDAAMQSQELKEYIENNKVCQISKSYIPKMETEKGGMFRKAA
jgi:hypothetical protein